jgi:DNA polymerase (family X)
MARLDRLAVAAALRETGALLAASGAASYKSRAYARGAKALEELSDAEFERLASSERLTELHGIGESLARQIAELFATGRSSTLERLRAEAPAGVPQRSDLLLARALDLATLLARSMVASGTTRRVEPAGPLRRSVEVVPRVDLVAESEHAAATIEAFTRLPFITRTLEREAAGATVLLGTGELAHLDAAPPRAFASLLLDRTGSDAHVTRLVELGREGGIRVAASGWRRGRRVLAAKSEKDLYASLGLPFIAPELREDDGEIEAARTGTLPRALVTAGDVRGYVHCHTYFSDGVESVLAMARETERRGKDYITITDHSPTAHYAGGLTSARLRDQWREIEAARPKVRVAILKGTESDILADGSLDYPDALLARLDVIVASLHTRNRQDRAAMTRRLVAAMRHPLFKIWGHPLGRLLRRRPPADCDVDAVLDALAESRGAVEVNGDPHRLDMEPRLLRRAKERGLKFVISTDAHSTSNLDFLEYGVAIARRGWLTPSDVLNTLDAGAFAEAVRPRAAARGGRSGA